MPSPTLADKIAKIIRTDILAGKLKPGQKLVVADLKERYCVGASPIREALVQLSWSRYVTLEPQKGCWVAPICKNDLSDLFDTLSVLSRILLAKSIQHGDESWELEVLTAFHHLSRLQNHSDEDWHSLEDRRQVFHHSLLDGAGAQRLCEFFNQTFNQVKRYQSYAMHQRHFTPRLDIDTHERLMKSALAKDTEQATALFEQQLTDHKQQLERALDLA
ncbi:MULTISPECIES: GntR family transcriptional regulator [unclassified Vibrio]|uniref:GntR family transcriptional regulator n=1 Tax=unclassified Vibrio TaxID=2614977 RepID=UPI0013612B7C|nr:MULTISPECIES: GntR family transcriptional regulator [unclassified Vibrio]NAW59037.1 GntR family transcriptional regulator [Vibrio sp. V36_P2S2PM302]NAX25706.1 GntR family transcriptional regulator [Vibrio sp. V38_P2S17PM301]NAX30097.1 GntR family transcriptional regulator [Vibrio sp. V37_P2S8PM304]